MKEYIFWIALMGIPAILLALSWWQWAILPPPHCVPTWRFQGMKVAIMAGSASVAALYGLLLGAYNLKSEYLVGYYYSGLVLCLLGLLSALVGKHASRILTFIAMLLVLLDWLVMALVINAIPE